MKNTHDFNSINIIVLIIDLIFIYFVSDHGISGLRGLGRFTPLRCPIIADNGHLVGHYPLRQLLQYQILMCQLC